MSKTSQYQKFLDQGQYSKSGLDRYEWLFGETFLSTGGFSTTNKVLEHVQFKEKNPKILDIGSGLGGHSFLMAERFGAEVLGLDLSENMMSIARRHLEKRPHLKDKIKFEIQDYTKTVLPENTFDLAYSRDSLMHIEDKQNLFKHIYSWLKPDGWIVFTDYVRGEDISKYSEEFREYINNRGYHMATVSEYREVLDSNGFKDVQVIDWRTEFKRALDDELYKLRNRKDEFLSKFTQEDFDDLESGWLAKLNRISGNNQGWVLGIGRKPMKSGRSSSMSS